MTKILFATDLHGNLDLYIKLYKLADNHDIKNVIIGGDICPHSGPSLEVAVKDQREFLKKFLIPLIKKNSHITTFIQMGNDDFRVNMDLLEEANKEGILKLTHKNVHDLDNYKIVGYSFVSELPFRLKDWEKKDNRHSRFLTDTASDLRTVKPAPGTIMSDISKIKRMSDPKKTIYSMHCPPKNTFLDQTHEHHVGSKSIRYFIEKYQPPLTLHGHIHESPQLSGEYKENINKTLCINPGSNHIESILNAVIVDLDNFETELIKW